MMYEKVWHEYIYIYIYMYVCIYILYITPAKALGNADVVGSVLYM